MMTENLSQLINNFFANGKRPYLFNRFLNTLVGLRSVDNWHHYTNSLLAAELRLRRGLTTANKSSESNRIQSSSSKLFDCIRTIPQIRRKPKHELNGERIQRILELLKFFCVENRRNRYLLSDHHRFTGRKFSHCNDRLQNAELKKTDKLFHRKHGFIWSAVSNILDTFEPVHLARQLVCYRWSAWSGLV